ncbi:MAG TPA: Rrf2 family transcriptional regulator [Longimicrobium sp.]|nr:Rrf2 family transcriptional regulator [Longimicrobium sp.]
MNSRFAVAVHILTLLAEAGGEPLTSERIAGSVNTNPSLVRRLLSALARAGLTTARHGAGGGALLAKAPGAVTLGDVYRAVDGGELFALHRERPNPACPVGRTIQGALEARIAAAERALEAELDRTTLAEMARDCQGAAAGAAR